MAIRVMAEKRFRLQITGGFAVLLSLLFWLDEGLGLLLPALAAAALHELGHVAAILLMGGTVKGIRLTAVGAEMELDGRVRFSYGKDVLAALAGPLASFLSAWAAAGLKLWIPAAMCAGQGAFNLLPVGPLDGGRALYASLAARWDEGKAVRVVSFFSAVVVGALLGGGLVLLRRFGNPTLMITAVWLLTGIFRRKE